MNISFRLLNKIVPSIIILLVVYNTFVIISLYHESKTHQKKLQTKIQYDELSESLSKLNSLVPQIRFLHEKNFENENENKEKVISLDENGHNQLTNTKYGLMIYNKHDEYVGKAIGLYGEWLDSHMTLFRYFVGIGDTVVDVGANIGALTVPLSKLVTHSGLVYAFEPQRVIYQLLCSNVQINQLRNVIAYPEAIASSKKSFSWNVHQDSYTSPSNFGTFPIKRSLKDEDTYETKGRNDEPVKANSLDSYFIKGSVSLIKVSVDGDMVIDVLTGAQGIIKKERPFLHISYPSDENEIFEFLEKFNYKIWKHSTLMYNPQNFKKSTTNQLNYIIYSIFALPKEKIKLFPDLFEYIISGTNEFEKVTLEKKIKPEEEY